MPRLKLHRQQKLRRLHLLLKRHLPLLLLLQKLPQIRATISARGRGGGGRDGGGPGGNRGRGRGRGGRDGGRGGKDDGDELIEKLVHINRVFKDS